MILQWRSTGGFKVDDFEAFRRIGFVLSNSLGEESAVECFLLILVLPLTHLNRFETNYAFPILRLAFVEAIDVYVCQCVCVCVCARAHTRTHARTSQGSCCGSSSSLATGWFRLSHSCLICLLSARLPPAPSSPPPLSSLSLSRSLSMHKRNSAQRLEEAGSEPMHQCIIVR